MANHKEDYGIYKFMCDHNGYTALAKSLSSAKSTKDTVATMKRITKSDIKYGHMGQLVIKDGICYSTFIQNPGDDTEVHDSVTSGVVLAVFKLEDAMSDTFDVEKHIEFFKIGSLGDTFAGYRAKSIFKDNSMCLVGDDIYIVFTFATEDNIAKMFSARFNTVSRTWHDETLCYLNYNGKEEIFSAEFINNIYAEKGYKNQNLNHDLIELVSQWSEYNAEYYATGVLTGATNNGFIVKTTDFKHYELVDTVPFNENGSAEIASIIIGNKMYLACRQNYSLAHIILSLYDLDTKEWGKYYEIADGTCRPWFFIKDGELYLINTIEELYRRYTNISRVFYDGWFCRDIPIEEKATLYDCGYYFATAEYDGRIYFVSSKDTISFGELKLTFEDPEKVNEKLLKLFE